jgi:translation initiation factor IF-1
MIKSIWVKLLAMVIGMVSLVGQTVNYDNPLSGPPPCAAMPWASQTVNGMSLSLNVLNVDPGTFVKTWLLNLPANTLESLAIVTPEDFDATAEIGTFTRNGHRFNVMVSCSTKQGRRFDSGKLTLESDVPFQLDRTSQIHLIGQENVGGACGYDSVWIGIRPVPTAAKLNYVRWVYQGRNNVIEWQSSVEYNMIGYRVDARLRNGKTVWGRLVPANGGWRPMTYYYTVPPDAVTVQLVEVDLSGGDVVIAILQAPPRYIMYPIAPPPPKFAPVPIKVETY